MAAISEDWPSLFEVTHTWSAMRWESWTRKLSRDAWQLARQAGNSTVPLLERWNRILASTINASELGPRYCRYAACNALTGISEHIACKEKTESERSQIRPHRDRISTRFEYHPFMRSSTPQGLNVCKFKEETTMTYNKARSKCTARISAITRPRQVRV